MTAPGQHPRDLIVEAGVSGWCGQGTHHLCSTAACRCWCHDQQTLALEAAPLARAGQSIDQAPTVEHLDGLAGRVLDAFARHPAGLTDHELVQLFPGTNDGTVRSLRSRLKNAGRLVATGDRRPTTGRTTAAVWRLATSTTPGDTTP